MGSPCLSTLGCPAYGNTLSEAEEGGQYWEAHGFTFILGLGLGFKNVGCSR